jgi:putative tryptophan/tyrosine transport system substrate-binding protein
MIHRRREFIALVVAGLVSHPRRISAQPHRIPVIGLLSAAGVTAVWEKRFREGLREHGYDVGQTVAIEHRSAEGHFDRLPELAADLVRRKVDVIVTFVTAATVAAKQATETIPIVMVAVSDPVGAGLVASLARPGGNVTGTSGQSGQIAPKSLEFLTAVVPKLRRVAVLWNPANAVFQTQILKATETAARALEIRLQLVGVRAAEDVNRAFEAMAVERAEALDVLADALLDTLGEQVAHRATTARLPSAGGLRNFAEAGGLLAYGPDFQAMFHRAGAYVGKILQGSRPADLPIEQSTKYELVINMKTAKVLGLTIPPLLLLRADEVIQ